MFVGPIKNDNNIKVKLGDKMQITTDETIEGKPGIVCVKNLHEFSSKLQEYSLFIHHYSNIVFFDMGSICAIVKNATKDLLEVEIQNDGIIYENTQVTFQMKQGSFDESEHNDE